MADYNILIVGTDPSLIGLLNIRLEREGYSVSLSDNVEDALSYLERKKFDTIVLDTHELGLTLHERVRSKPETAEIPFILLNVKGQISIKPGPGDSIIEEVEVDTVVAKIKELLQISKKPEKSTSMKSSKASKQVDVIADLAVTVEDWVVFKGRLEKIGIHEIIKGLSLMGKSGKLLIIYGNRKGLLSFTQGRITHAIAGNLKGEKAISRLLLWQKGQFLFDPQTTFMEQNVQTPTETLLIECSRRLDRYKYLLAQLPPFDTRIGILSMGRLKTLTSNEMKILSLANRQLPLLNLIETSPLDDMATVEAITRLYTEKVIGDVEEEESSEKVSAPEHKAALEGNLKEINIGEIIQILVLIQKDGRLLIVWEDRKGEVYLHKGNITYATVENLKGESAVYRLLTWREGKFRFDTGILINSKNVQKSLESIFFEGLDILEEYKRFMEEFPSLNAYVEVISVTGQEKISPVEAKLLKIVNECDTLNDVINHSPFDDLKTLKILARLHSDRIIGVSKGAPDKKSSNIDYNQIADDLFG